jgi:hypothetical protein
MTHSLEQVQLSAGSHRNLSEGVCVMECVAYIYGEGLTDRPECACPVITAYAQTANDVLAESMRQQLTSRVLRIVGSKSTPEVEQARLLFAVDYALRKYLPRLLGRVPGREDLAKRLAALPALSPDTRDQHRAELEFQMGHFRGETSLIRPVLEHRAIRAAYELRYLLEQMEGLSTERVIDMLSTAFSFVEMESGRLEVLDGMLDLGQPRQSAPVTPEMEGRLARLVSITREARERREQMRQHRSCGDE